MEEANMPFVLKCWHTVATSLPAITIPFIKSGRNGQPINISVSLFSALVLSAINAICGRVLLEYGFPANGARTMEVTASLTAEFHSNTLLVGLAYLFATCPYQPSAKMSKAPQWWQECCDAVLSFCIGYMIYDFGFIIVKANVTNNGELTSDDSTFMAHHIMTIVYMMQARIYGAGHFSAMICMFLGECTNPFHNGFYIFRHVLSLDIYNSSVLLHNLEKINNFLLAISYVSIRAAIGPIFFLHVTYDLLVNGRSNGLPIWVIAMWVLLIWGVEYGSIPWVERCWGWLQDDYYPAMFGEADVTSEL